MIILKFCKKSLLISIFFFPMYVIYGQYTETDIHNYIDQYREIAQKKMQEYKIPASITLAQGIFESACGTSRLAKEGNNHFGIKCHKNWEGDTIRIDDDELQECFRKYQSVEESFNDHSLFLTTRSRYKDLFSLNILDYPAWARGLKIAGYATNPEYANRLISLIERFNIAYWDTAYVQHGISMVEKKVPIAIADTSHKLPSEEKSIVQKEKKSSEQPTNPENTSSSTLIFTASSRDFPISESPWTQLPVYENNKTQFVIAQQGDTYKSIAQDVQRTEKELRKFNDAPTNAKLVESQVVYIENKNKKWHLTHRVNKGETLRYIAQKYAVQLHYIFQYNHLNEKSIIQPGDNIKLSY